LLDSNKAPFSGRWRVLSRRDVTTIVRAGAHDVCFAGAAWNGEKSRQSHESKRIFGRRGDGLPPARSTVMLPLRGAALTVFAMLAFAGNSIICRLALKEQTIDPASFTAVRLAAGALALALIVRLAHRGAKGRNGGGWSSALALFLYAAFFSYAYLSLDAASGALILFGFVQVTMIGAALMAGDRPAGFEWGGWLLAAAGLTLLLLPGAAAPAPGGAALMALAGVAWGVYSIRGRREAEPLLATSRNFTRSLLFVAGLALFAAAAADGTHWSANGLLLAMLSGALTSGLGYVIWYAALNYLSSMQAALVQLSVPAIAAAGGVLLLAEPLSPRLVVCGTMIIGGICVALLRKARRLPA
jgi:drug/metabolite transporter (DMT)-like permease